MLRTKGMLVAPRTRLGVVFPVEAPGGARTCGVILCVASPKVTFPVGTTGPDHRTTTMTEER
ncbi:MAG: hypothetical protein AVDCRST_MAG25-18 [uncultured Rubrobacteraceae bacterium]|uniref:Uncharacterized protein n=1 Tax=uncultured Rubrobacteraceae bacterium TaxID=349277 RepID=A0A6J4QU82_9ACTN|nr:MAG: hypothetical protein AVDCRST_MAG25-18 [uncultured Rubrobacteraceae bacterium]